MNSSFAQKKAIVLGGSYGLGKSIAAMLLKNGVATVIAGKEKITVDQAVEELTALGEVTGHVLDLSHDYNVELFLEEVADCFAGEIDFLVNAAGSFHPRPFLETKLSEYDALLDMNRGFFIITQEIVRKMQLSGGGSVVTISSFLSRQALKCIPSVAFAMAKAGLEAFTKHLSVELSAYHIRINTVSLGIMENGTLDAYTGDLPPSLVRDMHHTIDSLHPVGHSGTIDEIVDVVEFLLSDKAANVNGAVWDVDGGLSTGRM